MINFGYVVQVAEFYPEGIFIMSIMSACHPSVGWSHKETHARCKLPIVLCDGPGFMIYYMYRDD